MICGRPAWFDNPYPWKKRRVPKYTNSYPLCIKQYLALLPKEMLLRFPADWYVKRRQNTKLAQQLLGDGHVVELYDIRPTSEELATQAVRGEGVCWVHWNCDYDGDTKITELQGDVLWREHTQYFGDKDFAFQALMIRQTVADALYGRLSAMDVPRMDGMICRPELFHYPASQGNRGTHKVGTAIYHKNSIRGYTIHGLRYLTARSRIDGRAIYDRYKVLVTPRLRDVTREKGPFKVLEPPIVAGKQTVCVDYFVVIGPYETREEALPVQSYFMTKFVRFFLYMAMLHGETFYDACKQLPLVPVDRMWTDEQLNERFGLNEDEIALIDGFIQPLFLKRGAHTLGKAD